MNEQANRDQEENMQVTMDFEALLTASAPQPRARFEEELSQRLRREFAQRRQARRVLTAVQPCRYGRVSAKTVAVVMAVLTIGIGAVIAMNTLLQQFILHDAGLRAIYEQGLGHEIGISQTIDGYTVTLEWAYADGNRLTVAYIIAGHPGTQYTDLSSDVYRLRVRDTGQEIPFLQGMSALIDRNGKGGGWGMSGDVLPTSDRSLMIRTHDLSAVETGGSPSLDLHLEVGVYGITLAQRTQMPIEQFDAMKEGPEGLFTFDFSIALVDKQRVFDTPLTALDQDITVTLRRVSVSPSQTRLVICFLPPDPARQWTAIPSLTTTQGEVPGGGGVQLFMDGDLTCNDYTYFAGMFEYRGNWQLAITELVGFGSGGGNDQQRISGSWVFEFVVP
jgi:hypothetical protein